MISLIENKARFHPFQEHSFDWTTKMLIDNLLSQFHQNFRQAKLCRWIIFFEAGVFNSEDDLFKSENLQSTEKWSMF